MANNLHQNAIHSLRKTARVLECQKKGTFSSLHHKKNLVLELLLNNSLSSLKIKKIPDSNVDSKQGSEIMGALINQGFDIKSLQKLDYLSDVNILKRIPIERKPLKIHKAADVILYLNCWADHLEENLKRTEITSPIDNRPRERFYSLL